MFYNDYYDLLERFSIMTVDGRQKDTFVLEYLQDKTTPELLEKLKSEITEIKQPAEDKNDNNVLNKYIKNKIGLYPCKEIENNIRPLCKIYDESKNIINENVIKDDKTLQSWKQKGVTIFAFYPQHYNYIVLDLDNSNEHANTTNGIKSFLDLIAGVEMNDQYKKYFEDFPKNYPCYVETPHNGIHLYFKASYIPNNWTPNKNELNALNIEIKYNNQVTTGGSIRNGKEYILRGNLEDAPKMNTAIIDLLTKGRPEPIKYTAGFKKTTNGKAWNSTPDGIINKALEKYSNLGNHEFIYKTAVLFKNAGFTKEIAKEYITKTPQHLGRKDQADTISAINSVF